MKLLASLLAVVALFAASSNAFVAPPAAAASRKANAQPLAAKKDGMAEATAAFQATFPEFSKIGMGPSTKAERWNGRHAMFGWVAIIATGYAKSHGLIPDADAVLNVKEWGTLAYLTAPATITNERAVILAANVHALVWSICATIAPFSSQDKLFLGKGEEAEPAAGLFVPIVPGLTPEAEMLNGRLAMLGLTLVAGHSVATGTSFLDSVNLFLGNMLL